VRAELPTKAKVIPSYEDVARDKDKFCEAQRAFTNRRLLAQGHANRYVIQYPAPDVHAEDLDWVYGLPFSRRIPAGFPELEMARFSVQTHRGCVGRCSFCALSLHQGDRVVSRSEDSILKEIQGFTRHPDFKGYVDDLGGPTANMYGMDRAAAEVRREGGRADQHVKRRARTAGDRRGGRGARLMPGGVSRSQGFVTTAS
jgi:radical SAM superfamily enzyme YgiQ (UPF0313 family)